MTKFNPTAVSGVARRVQRYRPSLVRDDAIHRNAIPGLKDLHRCLGMRPKVAIDTKQCCYPLTRCAVSQKRLQSANDIAGRTLLKSWYGTAIRQAIPRERVNRTADHQAGSLLEVLYCYLDLRSKICSQP